MKGRITLLCGDVTEQQVDAIVNAASIPPGESATEAGLRSGFRRSLDLARERGCRTLAAPAVGAGIAGLPLQRCAEVLLEEARAHLAGQTPLEEIRFVLPGEPELRMFEMVNDAAKVMESLARLRGGGR